MCALVEAEATGPAVDLRGRVDALKVLPLVLGHAGVGEAADLRMAAEDAREQRRPAPVQAADEDQAVLPVAHAAVS